jgi:murein L,D-transpeptidase YcbB/YkuD
MPLITVYLGEICTNSGLSASEKTSIQRMLSAWFTTVCTGSAYTASVVWTNAVPAAITATDLVCYFMPSQSESVLRKAPGYSSGAGVSHGFTFRSATANASEVYVSSCRGDGVKWFAELAFHELMHNKLDLGNQELHAKGGIAAAAVSAGMTPSTSNYSDMRAALATSRIQWAGGWAAVHCPDPNDPLAGLGL